MYALPSAPLSVGGVVDDAIRLFRSSFTRCWAFSAIIAVALFGMQLAMMPFTPNLARSGPASASQVLATLGDPRLIGASIAAYLALMIVSLVFYGGLLTVQAAVARGDDSVGVGRALTTGLRRAPGMLLAALLYCLAVAGGLILLIIPGLWVSVRLYLWMAAMFTEESSALASLETSWRLTKGHWWRAVAILSVTLVIFLVVSMAFGLVAGIIVSVTHSRPADARIIQAATQVVPYFIGYPFLTAAWLARYHDCMLRRVGGDLAARMGALSSA